MDPENKERLAGLPGGSAEEAEQVNQFLEKEHEKFQKVEPSPEEVAKFCSCGMNGSSSPMNYFTAG